MKKETCIVSVIMPAYNAEAYIEQAIKSVLKQNVPLELIVVDDASTDSTEAVVQQYLTDQRIIYIRNSENQGVAASRNVGVRKAHGKYIAFLDADDWWKENKLSKQIGVLQTKQAVLCYTARGLYNDEGHDMQKVIHVKDTLTYHQLLRSNSISCSSVLMKREIALEFPMSHDEYHEDYMVWLKCLEKYGAAYGIDEPLLCYRMSKKGKSRKHIQSAVMTYGMHRCMGKSSIEALYYTISHLINAVIKYWKVIGVSK